MKNSNDKWSSVYLIIYDWPIVLLGSLGIFKETILIILILIIYMNKGLIIY